MISEAFSVTELPAATFVRAFVRLFSRVCSEIQMEHENYASLIERGLATSYGFSNWYGYKTPTDKYHIGDV